MKSVFSSCRAAAHATLIPLGSGRCGAAAGGTYSLAEVRRLAQAQLLGVLVLHGQLGLLHQAAAQGGPDGAHRQRPRGGQLSGVVERVGQQVVGLAQPVAQTERLGLLASDAPTGEQQVGRGLPADRRRQGDRQCEAVVESEPGEVGAEVGWTALATRKSADSASPNPPPIAAPCTAATTGSGAANSRSAAR